MELECPVCGEWIDLHEFAVQTDCPTCQTHLIVDHDADFRDGSWHDKTKLIPQQFKSYDRD